MPEGGERGGVGSGRYEPPATAFKSLSSIGMWLIALLAVTVLIDLIVIVSGISYVDLIDRIESGANVTFEEADSADQRQGALAFVELIAFAITAVVFIIWFRRAYRNMAPLGVSWYRFKAGWAVGGWFVPFLNLVRPKQIANDIWRTSDPDLPPRIDGPGLGRPVSPLLNWWWGVFLISGWIARTTITAPADDSLDAIKTSTEMALPSSVFDAIAALLAAFVVLKITRRQHQRAASLSAAQAAEIQDSHPTPS